MSDCFESDEICILNTCYIINGWSLNVTNISTIDSPYSTLGTDIIIFADATAGATTIQLPASPQFPNQMYMVRKTDPTYNTVTILPGGADTIDGDPSYTLARPDEVIYLVYDAGEWKYINNKTDRILNAKGDLLTSNGTTAVRLPVGADGQVLVANSAQPTGLEWTTISAMQKYTYSLLTILVSAIDVNWATVGYFPWNTTRHSTYTNGIVITHVTIPGAKTLDIRFYDSTNAAVLGSSLAIAVSGPITFAVSNPGTNAICELQVKKSAHGNPSPLVHGVILEFN